MCLYRGNAAKVARKIKSASNGPLAEQIGSVLANWFQQQILCSPARSRPTFDLVLPISQHWFRRYHERYNQAEILAKIVARKLDCPWAPKGLVRIKWSEKQGTKTIQERLKNMEGTMLLQTGLMVTGKRVLLVDDILTSGATASEAARVLKKAQCKSVDVLAFARGASAQN